MGSSTAPSPSQLQSEETVEARKGEGRGGLAVLNYIGFKLKSVTPRGVEGSFTVSDRSCQPFGVLHGGLSAFIAEALASMGAEVASNWKRVAGIELNINHLRAIRHGEEVTVTATPLMVGNRVQVWDVKLSTSKPSNTTTGTSLDEPSAVARVTLIVGLPLQDTRSKERLQQCSKL